MAADRAKNKSAILDERRKAVILEATRLINSRGVSAIRLSDLAARLKMPRKSLYYYAQNREAVVAACFTMTCDLLEEGLDLAYGPADLALTGFIRHQFSDETRSAVALVDVDWLPPGAGHTIHERMKRITQRLAALIERGSREALFVSHPPMIAAHILLSMLSWARTSQQWTDDLTLNPNRVAAALCDIILNGIATDAKAAPDPMLDLSLISSPTPDIFDREQLHRARIERLAQAASGLFNRNGIEATSIDDIAMAIGITKGSIYHHFPSKAALVASCYERAYQIQSQILEVARSNAANGAHWLRNAVYLNSLAHVEGIAPLATLPGIQSLPDDLRERVMSGIGGLFATVSRIYELGISDGSIRELDYVIADSVVGGAMAWVPQWLGDFKSVAKRELAEQINAILFTGLRKRQEAARRG
ncbi:TetR family transcriptional regulator [Novosphingobium sp. MW5]|nr:TetR family transcriptional regulator [Novosphingobium sp. MW5]